MVALVKHIPADEASKLVIEAIESGRALDKMREWIAAQGGDARCVDDTSYLPSATVIYPVICDRDGYITETDAQLIGASAMILGAGRESKEDKIDPAAGIVIKKKPGDKVKKGEVLCHLHCSDVSKIKDAEATFRSAVKYGTEAPAKQELIYKIIR